MKTLKAKKTKLSDVRQMLKDMKNFNLDFGNGTFIMHVGGILSKLKDGEQYFAIGGKWVKS